MSAEECRVCERIERNAERAIERAEDRAAKAAAEVTRLRAALAEIAALQTEKPTYDGDEHHSRHARRVGEYRAAEMARKGLVQP